jgi:hypothetical protein
MEEQNKNQKPRIENLELNRETVADLAEEEGEKVEGGVIRQPGACMSCNDSCSPSNARP